MHRSQYLDKTDSRVRPSVASLSFSWATSQYITRQLTRPARLGRKLSARSACVTSLVFPGQDDMMTDSVVYVLTKTLWK